MSGSIAFRHGPFQGWGVSLHSTWDDGQMTRVTVQIATPDLQTGRPLSGLLSFRPGIDGWEQAWSAEMHGGPAAMAEMLEWIIEATSTKLASGAEIDPALRAYWQQIIDEADHTRAEFFARYPDGQVPVFEVVGRYVYDGSADTLLAEFDEMLAAA